MALADFERRLVAATQSGLPLVPKPYEALAAMLGTSSQAVREGLAQMKASGLIRRTGVTPDPQRLAYSVSALSVWDVADDRVDALGLQLGALPGVSRCDRRPRQTPVWPYNLFAALHGHTRDDIEAQAQAVRSLLGAACRAGELLYTVGVLKKTGLRLRDA